MKQISPKLHYRGISCNHYPRAPCWADEYRVYLYDGQSNNFGQLDPNYKTCLHLLIMAAKTTDKISGRMTQQILSNTNDRFPPRVLS